MGGVRIRFEHRSPGGSGGDPCAAHTMHVLVDDEELRESGDEAFFPRAPGPCRVTLFSGYRGHDNGYVHSRREDLLTVLVPAERDVLIQVIGNPRLGRCLLRVTEPG